MSLRRQGHVGGLSWSWPWGRVALAALLIVTSVMYLWALGSQHWAFEYYSAAVQAATKSWKAFLFGSVDASNFITVDKAPGSIWVMALSARLFGFSPAWVLLPQALEGIATVYLVYATVRRWAPDGLALLAAGLTGCAPVSIAVFRFNNPDALLTLLLVAGAYAVVRSTDSGSFCWAVLAGACVGAAFLAKMTEALLVVPSIVAVHLLASPGPFARRLARVGAGAAGLVISAGWWVVVVLAVPSSSRPYLGSTRDNSVLSLLFGYNGLDHLSGVPHAGAFGRHGQLATLGRLFQAYIGSQVSWQLPATLLLVVAAAWMLRRRSRQDRTLAGIVLWGSWLFVILIVFSVSQGTVNPYYTVIMAPAIGASLALGLGVLWAHRSSFVARGVLSFACALSGIWAFWLLRKSGEWIPGTGFVALAAGALGLSGIMGLEHWGRRGLAASVCAVIAVGLVPEAGSSVGAVVNPAPSSDPYAEPPGAGVASRPAGGDQVLATDGRPGSLIAMLDEGSSRFRWVVATVAAGAAAGYELATGEPAMAIGGWSGSDPAPSLIAFERVVARHQVHYFASPSQSGGISLGRSFEGTPAVRVTAWVTSHFSPRSVDGITLYDLTRAPRA